MKTMLLLAMPSGVEWLLPVLFVFVGAVLLYKAVRQLVQSRSEE